MAVFSQESMDRFRAESRLKEHGPELLELLKAMTAYASAELGDGGPNSLINQSRKLIVKIEG